MKRISACTKDCPDCCSLLVEKTDKGLKISGNPDHPFTQGVACAKGIGHHKQLARQDRITQPLLREGNVFQPISWDDALDLCARQIQKLRGTPGSLLHVRGYGYRGALAQASNHFFQELGSAHVIGSLCDDTGIEACLQDFGALRHNDPSDILNAQRIVNWGRDLSSSSIHLGMLIKKARKNGTRVLTIAPGGDGNLPFSDAYIRIKPGTDRFLAAAIIKLAIVRGDIDARITEHTSNWSDFSTLLNTHDVLDLLQRCNVPPKAANMLYEWYFSGESTRSATATLIGWGIQRYVRGGENVRFINALSLLAGNVGKKGGGVSFNISSGQNLASWHTPTANAPQKRSTFMLWDLPNAMEKASPAIQMAWVDGHNIVNQIPNAAAMAYAFAAIDFTVVVDAFFNDTVSRADLVLPCTLALEREDVLGSCMHHYVNHAAKATNPPGEARFDFDILSDLGRRLDPAIVFPDKDTCLERALQSPYLNTSLAELREKGFVRATHEDIPFANLEFGHEDQKFHLCPTLSNEPLAPEQFPLQLLTLIDKRYMHSQIPEEEQQAPVPAIISPDNPMLAGLCQEEDVFLVSDIGKIEVKLKLDATLHPSVVVIRRGGWMKCDATANILISPKSTDIGDGAALYNTYVRLEN